MRRIAVLPMLAVCAATLSAQTAAPAAQTTPAAPPSLNAQAAAPASAPIPAEKQAKVEKLIALLTTDSQLKAMIAQTQQQLHAQVAQRANAGTTDEQKKIGADYLAKVDAATAQLSWEKVKPEVIRAYADEFTDADLDAFIAFFSSPAGHDFITKSPIVGNKVGDAARAQLREIAPTLQAATREFNEKMKAATPPTLSPLEPPHAPATTPAPTK